MAIDPAEQRRIIEGTGVSWERWLEVFDGRDATDHTGLAALATEVIAREGNATNPGWWGQGAAIAYEHHVGARIPGQQHDGTFRVAISRTLDGDLSTVHQGFTSFMAEHTELGGIGFAGQPHTSVTVKRSYWRVGLADGSRFEVGFEPRGQWVGASLSRQKIVDPNDTVGVREALIEVWTGFLATITNG